MFFCFCFCFFCVGSEAHLGDYHGEFTLLGKVCPSTLSTSHGRCAKERGLSSQDHEELKIELWQSSWRVQVAERSKSKHLLSFKIRRRALINSYHVFARVHLKNFMYEHLAK